VTRFVIGAAALYVRIAGRINRLAVIGHDAVSSAVAGSVMHSTIFDSAISPK
jgi:hypothetical protein